MAYFYGKSPFSIVKTYGDEISPLAPGHDADLSAARFLMDTYVSNASKYVLFEHDHKPRTLKRALNVDTLLAHVDGVINVGVFASERDGAKFLCFDIDIMDTAVVRQVIAALAELGIDKPTISVSGSKGYHVEVIYDRPVPMAVNKAIYDEVIRLTGLNPRKVEYRPTAKQAIRLPITKHYKTLADSCYALDDGMNIVPARSLDAWHSVKRFSAKKAEAIAKRLAAEREDVPPAEREECANRVDLENLPSLREPGTRHGVMLGIAIGMRYAGMTEREIELGLIEWVADQDWRFIGSSLGEVKRDAAELAHWVSRDEFRVVNKRVVITTAELGLIVKGKSKSDRRVLFALIYYRKAFGFRRMSQRFLAARLGITTNTVAASIGRLERDGIITRHRGATRITDDGGFVTEPCEYELGEAEPVGRDVTIDWSVDWRELLPTYATVMWRGLGDELQGYVKRSEAEEIAARRIDQLDEV